jgi:hypothetical protein
MPTEKRLKNILTILATLDAEIWRITCQASLGKVSEIPSQAIDGCGGTHLLSQLQGRGGGRV